MREREREREREGGERERERLTDRKTHNRKEGKMKGKLKREKPSDRDNKGVGHNRGADREKTMTINKSAIVKFQIKTMEIHTALKGMSHVSEFQTPTPT